MKTPGEMSVLIFIGSVLIFCGLVLHVVGLATPDWSLISVANTEYGPFTHCIGTDCGSTGKVLESFGIETAAVDAVRTFTLLGAILGLLALVATIIIICLGMQNKVMTGLTPFALITAAIAAVSIVIAAMVWGGAVQKDVWEIGYSLVFCVVGASMIVGGAFLVWLGGREIKPADVPEAE